MTDVRSDNAELFQAQLRSLQLCRLLVAAADAGLVLNVVQNNLRHHRTARHDTPEHTKLSHLSSGTNVDYMH